MGNDQSYWHSIVTLNFSNEYRNDDVPRNDETPPPPPSQQHCINSTNAYTYTLINKSTVIYKFIQQHTLHNQPSSVLLFDMNPYLRPRPNTTTASPPQHRNGVVRRNQGLNMNDASQSTVPNSIRHPPERRPSRSSSGDGVVQGPMMPTPPLPYQTAWQLLSHSTQPQSVEHEKNNDRVGLEVMVVDITS